MYIVVYVAKDICWQQRGYYSKEVVNLQNFEQY